MAFMQYLVFDGENIPKPTSYDRDLSDVVADSSGETEAGTTQRDIVREGVNDIKVAFRVSQTWLKKFAVYKKKPSITVGFIDSSTMLQATAEMYIDGYKEKLVHDTSYGGLWEVSFTLKQF